MSFVSWKDAYIFEIWHNPLNVSALAIGGRKMKKKKIYENRQMNLKSLLALREKSNEIVASNLENTVCVCASLYHLDFQSVTFNEVFATQ